MATVTAQTEIIWTGVKRSLKNSTAHKTRNTLYVEKTGITKLAGPIAKAWAYRVIPLTERKPETAPYRYE